MTKRNAIWQLYVDTGGTFTDCIGVHPDGKIKRCKVLSTGALRGVIREVIGDRQLRVVQDWNAPDGFINGFEFSLSGSRDSNRVLRFNEKESLLTLKKPLASRSHKEVLNKTFDVRSGEDAPLLAARLITGTIPEKKLPEIDLRLATTKATNALLERKGAPTLLLTTRGFRDLLRIGNQQRPDLFSLKVDKPKPLYTEVLEVPERIDSEGQIVRELTLEKLKPELDAALGSVESVAICLVNSYKNPVHEEQLADYIARAGVGHLSVSSRLSRSINVLTRAQTTEVNAYLGPLMERFVRRIGRELDDSGFSIMTSTGGLSGSKAYQPKDGLLSGPAGGVTGAAAIGRTCGADKIISFDMGGTSSDVSRYNSGFDYQKEHRVGETLLATPALSIETVASGGGSICDFDGESLTTGPESAGADPGPACYGAGGPLTITDVNLLAGRLDPSNFHIPVDIEAAKDAFHELFHRIRKKRGGALDGRAVLDGFLDIANEKMAQAINTVSTSKGFDPAEYTLVAFGGAGGQHATAVASKLDIKQILIPSDAGLLSANGLSHARIEKIETLQCLKPLAETEEKLPGMFESLIEKAQKQLNSDGVDNNRSELVSRTLFARLEDQESTLEIPWEPGVSVADNFKQAYTSQFGHWIDNRAIEIESIRVIMAETAKSSNPSEFSRTGEQPKLFKLRYIDYKGGRLELPVYQRDSLKPGMELESPVLVLDPYSTLFAEPGWSLSVRSDRTLELNKISGSETGDTEERSQRDQESQEVQRAQESQKVQRDQESQQVQQVQQDQESQQVQRDQEENRDRPGRPAGIPSGRRDEGRDPAVNLQLYTNRFSAIADEMGEMLRRTALSVNIKERLDFSCALLDRNGYLVVNAPHIPVHLGAMGLCVRTLLKNIDMNEGDVVLTNHPAFGGSHLPDITVVTPIFYRGERIGFAANRAHHAEIGGKTPGSMPPDAQNLEEEGVVIPPEYLVRDGESRWDVIRKLLTGAPWPSRAVDENLADLKAAVAANQRGNIRLREMAKFYGTDEVTHYMSRLKSYAAERMKQTLLKLEDGIYHAEESMDDGSILRAECTVRGDRLKINFSGTSPVHPQNLNANPSIVNSVIMYVLRLLVDEPLPLNDGLLMPVEIDLPESMLNPPFPDAAAECPAVVGGNIETSQRLADTLLKAFEMAACSQGTMNNILFGNDTFGYYETVGGGTGAGEGFHGADAVHHHMTNTRATDPEIFEHRYPARLETFAVRKDSGGEGHWNGGNGITREILFLEQAELSLLTQHRVTAPYGMHGGHNGKPGNQKVIRKNAQNVQLKWKDHIVVEPGDRLVLNTPGGGGYSKHKNL